jgi:hypothetical protein
MDMFGPDEERNDRVVLDPWEELTGTLERLEPGEHALEVHLSSGTLVYDCDSAAANRIRAQCSGRVGATVAILRTASPSDPIRVAVEDAD